MIRFSSAAAVVGLAAFLSLVPIESVMARSLAPEEADMTAGRGAPEASGVVDLHRLGGPIAPDGGASPHEVAGGSPA